MKKGENLTFLFFRLLYARVVQPGIISPLAPEDVKEALHAAPRLEEALLGLPEGVALQAHLGAGEDVIHLQVGYSYSVGLPFSKIPGVDQQRSIKALCFIILYEMNELAAPRFYRSFYTVSYNPQNAKMKDPNWRIIIVGNIGRLTSAPLPS